MSVYKIKLKQPDRFLWWLRFQWFKITKPKEYNEMELLVEELHKGLLERSGISDI